MLRLLRLRIHPFTDLGSLSCVLLLRLCFVKSYTLYTVWCDLWHDIIIHVKSKLTSKYAMIEAS